MGMEDQAAQKLGEPVLYVATVSSKGTGKGIMTAGIAGQLGGALGAATAGTIADGRAPRGPGGHKGYMVLALTDSKLGFLKQKSGLLKPSCGDLLDSVPRDEITAFELGGGSLTSPLKIALADGTEIELEVPRVHKGKVEKLKSALGR